MIALGHEAESYYYQDLPADKLTKSQKDTKRKYDQVFGKKKQAHRNQ